VHLILEGSPRRLSLQENLSRDLVKFQLLGKDRRGFPQPQPTVHLQGALIPASLREHREISDEVEVRCDACNGTGLQPVQQPTQPGQRIYPTRCPKCGGKGRLKVS
jgi:hypothetical protein